MRRGLLLATVLGATALTAVPLAFAQLAETPVAATTRNEFKPAADFHAGGDELITYSRSRTGHPRLYDAILRRISGTGTTVTKLNLTGRGYGGGIDSPNIVYQQVVSGQSNIRLYNIDTDTRTSPAGANTPKWEYSPSISGDRLLFGRDDLSSPTQRVVLHQISSGSEQLLAQLSNARYQLVPGQVQGDWATYTRCAPVCNVVLYDVLGDIKTVLPKPNTSRPRYQYAGAVTSTGVVYLARSGPRCGSNIKIVRYFGASDPPTGTVVAALPTGKDILSSFARENGDGSTDVFYDRVGCTTGRFDVYKVTDPA
jgi:hypothetical protein